MRLPNDSEDDGVISLRACEKFRRCKTRVGYAEVSCGSGSEDRRDSSLEKLLSNGCCGDEMVIDGEALLSVVAAGAIGSESDDDKDSSIVIFSSNCCCGGDDRIIDGEDSSLIAGIGVISVSDEDVEGVGSPSVAAAGAFGDSDGRLAMGGPDFQGSSTCSLTESNAADTQRSEI